MIISQTVTKVSDNTGVKKIKVFHLYGGFIRKKTSIGNFIKGACKFVKRKRRFYKGFKVKRIRKGKVVKAYIVTQAFKFNKIDSSSIRFKINSSLIMKKKNIPHSKYILGTSIRNGLKKKKLNLIFKKII